MLGLSQVYGLIRQLGGTVRIASAVGAGTTVELPLPRAAAAPAELRGATAGFATGVASLLVVDDDADVRTRPLHAGGRRLPSDGVRRGRGA